MHLLADLETLKLLNKMAGGLWWKHNEDETVEENFELRTAPLKDWTDLVLADGTETVPLELNHSTNFTKRQRYSTRP